MVTANRVLNRSGSACNVWTTLQPPPKSITLYSVHPRCPAHRVMGNDQPSRRGGGKAKPAGLPGLFIQSQRSAGIQGTWIERPRPFFRRVLGEDRQIFPGYIQTLQA